MSHRSGPARGFTLVELLVALAVLALLAAALFPAFAAARVRARQSACLANERQLYLACALYAQDNGGLLPPYPSRAAYLAQAKPLACVDESALLLASLGPYVRSGAVWRCPSDTSRPAPGQEVGCGEGSIPFPNLTSYDYKGVRQTSRGLVPLPIDLSGTRGGSSARVLLMDSAYCPQDVRYGGYNHGGRWNRVWLDGHATSFGLDCTNYPMDLYTP